MQRPAEGLDGLALGTMLRAGVQHAVGTEIHLGADQPVLAVEQARGSVDRLVEASAQMLDAIQEPSGGLRTRPGIAAIEMVGVIAVCCRVGHLGPIGRPDRTERCAAAR